MSRRITLILKVIALMAVGVPAQAQTTNAFPASGNVGIGTTSPAQNLTIQTPSGTTTSTIGMSANGAQSYANYTITRTDNGTGSGMVTFLEGYWGANVVWAHSSASGTVTAMQLSEQPSSQGNGAHSLAINNESSATGGVLLNSGGSSFLNGGNVGIGTLSPQALLDVNGGVRISGSGAGLTFPDGTIQGTAYTGTCVATGGDYAESVAVIGEKTEYEPGDVIVVDPRSPGHFVLSAEPYSTLVAGIYSTKPGYVGRRQGGNPKLASGEIPMAMVGIVPTKVSPENGPIHTGDLLVAASRPGYAMKGTDRLRMIGAILGKALGDLDSGSGTVEVLVSLQ